MKQLLFSLGQDKVPEYGVHVVGETHSLQHYVKNFFMVDSGYLGDTIVVIQTNITWGDTHGDFENQYKKIFLKEPLFKSDVLYCCHTRWVLSTNENNERGDIVWNFYGIWGLTDA